MKVLVPALLACLAGVTAHAENPSFEQAIRGGQWHGCVYEDGYAPYSIVLTPRGADFFVSYPELDCTGGHNVRLGPDGFDAMEIIIANRSGRCASNLPLRYTMRPDHLRIDYFGGESGTYAMLRPAASEATPPACNKAEAVS